MNVESIYYIVKFLALLNLFAKTLTTGEIGALQKPLMQFSHIPLFSLGAKQEIWKYQGCGIGSTQGRDHQKMPDQLRQGGGHCEGVRDHQERPGQGRRHDGRPQDGVREEMAAGAAEDQDRTGHVQ